jgi:hypothetical protein
MLSARLDRARPGGDRGRPRHVVGAFRCRAHAERAIGALLDEGFRPEQIRLEGPVALLARPADWPVAPVRAGGPEAVVCGLLLGAAAWRVAPAPRPAWLRGTLGLPALGLTLLAALTAIGNREGVELYPWTVDVVSSERTPAAGGLLRAFGGRGVHLN